MIMLKMMKMMNLMKMMMKVGDDDAGGQVVQIEGCE